MTADYSSSCVRGGIGKKNRYSITLRCKNCGHTFKKVMWAYSIQEIDDRPNPPCPKCKVVREKIPPFDIAAGKAPAIVGSNAVRAADIAANMVMEDNGLTDIRGPTETRRGEPSTVKLAPHLQAVADNMFGGSGSVPALVGGGQTVKGANIKRPQLKIAGMNPNSAAFRRAVLGGGFSAGGAVESAHAISTEHQRRQRPMDVARIVNEGKE